MSAMSNVVMVIGVAVDVMVVVSEPRSLINTCPFSPNLVGFLHDHHAKRGKRGGSTIVVGFERAGMN